MTEPSPTIRTAIAQIYHDAHTEWPEMKANEWPDQFAYKIIATIKEHPEEVLALLEEKK